MLWRSGCKSWTRLNDRISTPSANNSKMVRRRSQRLALLASDRLSDTIANERLRQKEGYESKIKKSRKGRNAISGFYFNSRCPPDYYRRNLSRANIAAPANSAKALVAVAGSISGAVAGIAIATLLIPESSSSKPSDRLATRRNERDTKDPPK